MSVLATKNMLYQEGGDRIDKIVAYRPQRFAREPTSSRRIVQASSSSTILSPYRSRISNLLRTLRAITETTRALELLSKEHPDVSKAVQNYCRLANVGHEMEFYGRGDKLRKDLMDEWTEFASKCNPISNAGLDGLIDQLHKTAVVYGGMGIEVEPSDELTDLVAIHALDPRWFEWEKVDGRWKMYQYQNGKKVYIDSPNVFYVPTDPDVDDPRGTLMLSSSIFAIDTQLQSLTDVAAVIHKVGYPREDIEILRGPIIEMARSLGKTTEEEIQKFMNEQLDLIYEQYRDLEPDSTFVHYDDVKPNLTKSANERGGVDVRAVNEFLDIFVLNGLGQMGVFQNRTSGITETWGTVQFKIFIEQVHSFRRNSKRLIESAARQWLRVKGVKAKPHFEHKPIDWESEETRWKVKRLKQAYWRMCQLMGWCDGDEAANKIIGHNAVGEPRGGALNERDSERNSDNDDNRDRQDAMPRKLRELQVVGRVR